jgi:hypothetical protein
VKVIEAGASPLDAVTTSAAEPPEIVCGTAKVRVPPPRLLMCRVACASPGLQSSCARNTVVESGIRIG